MTLHCPLPNVNNRCYFFFFLGSDHKTKINPFGGNAPLQKGDQSAVGSDTVVGYHVLLGYDQPEFNRTSGQHLQVQQGRDHQYAGKISLEPLSLISFISSSSDSFGRVGSNHSSQI